MERQTDIELFSRLEQLNRIGASLSRERNIERLLENILEAAKTLTGADGGTLYSVSSDGCALHFEIMRTDSLGIRQGGTTGHSIDLPDLVLRRPNGTPNDSMVAVHAALHGRTVNVSDAYAHQDFDFSGTKAFDKRTGYRSQSLLTVPMKDHQGELIGVLQLLNAKHPVTSEVIAFTQSDQSLTESLASQAAIALSNRLLITQLEQLFESFVKLINIAIDEKSPYTGGHCERVPALTMMLAEAAHATSEGPLASFSMSERDRYELQMAGLLHDCGKITTPVHVVDKATKLHTLYDRIGVIDTRFEVLRRDAEIEALRAQLALRPLANAHAEAAITAALHRETQSIDQDRKFLRECNVGTEAMQQNAQQRVRDIGDTRRWRNAEGVQTAFLTADEIENLTIRSGTLTQAERDVINNHIVATNKMLEALPWPPHLKNVPEYAGGHHERMDGKGYPRGLTREQMSVQARVMGIADIFEALTAADRPYKSGMKLSQALAIMERMKHGGHIDPDLLDVFVGAQVYLPYAEKFLEPEQLDLLPICPPKA